MRWVIHAAAAEIAVTGLILFVSPVLFGQLIFAAEMSEPGQALGRLASMALLGFALTSWPLPSARPVVRAMLIYNLLATAYLSYLGFVGNLVGVLLWPAVALHLSLAGLLAAQGVSTQRA